MLIRASLPETNRYGNGIGGAIFAPPRANSVRSATDVLSSRLLPYHTEELGATDRTLALHGIPSVLHRYFFRILHFPLLTTLDAVGFRCHVLCPPLCVHVAHDPEGAAKRASDTIGPFHHRYGCTLGATKPPRQRFCRIQQTSSRDTVVSGDGPSCHLDGSRLAWSHRRLACINRRGIRFLGDRGPRRDHSATSERNRQNRLGREDWPDRETDSAVGRGGHADIGDEEIANLFPRLRHQ